LNVGKAAEPAAVEFHDAGDLRLLRHDFGNEDAVRIVCAAPGKIAPVQFVPIEEESMDVRDVYASAANRATTSRFPSSILMRGNSCFSIH
jgi:hypothetical protein